MARLHSPLVDRHRTSGYLPYGSVRSSGLSLEVAATRTAAAELERRPLPLLVELEVLFSCLIRKSVTCSDLPEEDALVVTDALHVVVRPRRFDLCATDGALVPFEATDPARLLPRFLFLDFDGDWSGEFSF